MAYAQLKVRSKGEACKEDRAARSVTPSTLEALVAYDLPAGKGNTRKRKRCWGRRCFFYDCLL